MEFLFLCSRNKRRSLTAERLFDGRNGIRVVSAGTESGARVKVTPGMLSRADIIFCMEKKHLRYIREKYADIISGKQVVCLNIPDEFEFMDEELIGLLESVVGEYMEGQSNGFCG